MTFAEPRWLPLLVVPGALLLLWAWRVLRRLGDIRRLQRGRTLPVAQRFPALGELAGWIFVIAAIAALVLALARPTASTTMPQRAGLDVVVLQDASASMRVTDVARRGTAEGDATRTRDILARDRWERSMLFLRELGDALTWTDDRLALVTFAHIAAPQIRLTRDPNTLFFFLDHLQTRPPFRLEDDTTWDTNLEQAVSWGMRLVDKDAEIHGRSANSAVFVLLSDGEAWSGEAATAIARVVERGIPLHVVGVGTLAGGALPVVRVASGELLPSPGVSRLERASLQRIAASGQGRYFELDRDDDRTVASTIVAEGRRLAPAAAFRATVDEMYWWFIAGAAAAALASLLFVRRRSELAWALAGSIATALAILPVL